MAERTGEALRVCVARAELSGGAGAEPVAAMAERLAARLAGELGTEPAELARVLEELLRGLAGLLGSPELAMACATLDHDMDVKRIHLVLVDGRVAEMIRRRRRGGWTWSMRIHRPKKRKR